MSTLGIIIAIAVVPFTLILIFPVISVGIFITAFGVLITTV